MSNKKSCDAVKAIMHDFDDVSDVTEIDFDHMGLKFFNNDQDAITRLEEITNDSGKHLLQSKIIKISS